MWVCIQRAFNLALLLLLGFVGVVHAGPGEGVTLHSWVLSPSLDLNATYDSNIYKDLTNRIDDVYGDRNLFCACAPVEAYTS